MSELPRLLSFDFAEDVELLCFSPEGTLLALASYEHGKEVLILDVASGKEKARYRDLGGVLHLAFRSETELLILQQDGCLICPLKKRPRSLPRKQDLEGESSVSYNGSFSPDGNTLALGINKALLLIDVPTGRVRARMPTPTAGGYVRVTLFSADGRYLAFAAPGSDYSYISFVVVWDLRRQKAARLLKLDSEDVDDLAFHPENRLLAVVTNQGGSISVFGMEAGRDGGAARYDLAAPTFSSVRNLEYGMGWSEPVADYSASMSVIEHIRFSADGKALKVVGYGGQVARLNARSGRELARVGPPEGYDLQGTVVNDRGLAASVVRDRKAVLLWDVPRWSDR